MNSKYKKLDQHTKVLVRRDCIRMIRVSIGDYLDDKKITSHTNEILFKKYEEIYSSDIVSDYLKYRIERGEYKPKKGFVYFVINDKNKICKIGFSLDPQKRLKQIQTGCPYPLRLYRQIEGTYELEKQLHKKFQQYKTNGEWFYIKDRLFEYLKGLA